MTEEESGWQGGRGRNEKGKRRVALVENTREEDRQGGRQTKTARVCDIMMDSDGGRPGWAGEVGEGGNQVSSQCSIAVQVEARDALHNVHHRHEGGPLAAI